MLSSASIGLAFLLVPLIRADPNCAFATGGTTQVVCTYDSSATAYTFTPPAGVSSIDISATGGNGGTGLGDSSGGQGAVVTLTDYPVNGQTLDIFVGQNGQGVSSTQAPAAMGGASAAGAPFSVSGGSGGGGSGNQYLPGSGGGSASLVTDSSTNLLLVAGAGGGAGYGGGRGGNGGAAGVLGQSAGSGQQNTAYPEDANSAGQGAVPDSATANGGPGRGGTSNVPGSSGNHGQGGNGGAATTNYVGSGAGGGGGYYGGGGSSGNSDFNQPIYGAGGGSSYISTDFASLASSSQSGAGGPSVVITYTAPLTPSFVPKMRGRERRRLRAARRTRRD